MSRIQPWRVLFLLLLLSLILTWPLLPNITTHVPGDGIDDPALAWNLWWAKYSWVDRAGRGGADRTMPSTATSCSIRSASTWPSTR